jgi:hypothetical protein
VIGSGLPSRAILHRCLCACKNLVDRLAQVDGNAPSIIPDREDEPVARERPRRRGFGGSPGLALEARDRALEHILKIAKFCFNYSA